MSNIKSNECKGHSRFWVKLNVDKLLNNCDTTPGDPSLELETIYGMKLCPSNSTAEAFPNDESCKLPEIMSILSCSMMLLAECVFWRGTMVSWVTFVTSAKLEFDGSGDGELALREGQELEILDDRDHS